MVTTPQIIMRPTAALKEYENNARFHSDTQILKIAASIQRFGFTQPILIGADDEVIAGHGRLAASRHLGLREVPCLVLSHLSERERRAYIIADNQLALSATWDFEKLSQEVSSLIEQDFDVELLGFDEQYLDALLKEDFSILPSDSEPAPTIHVSGHERKVSSGNPTPDFEDQGIGYKRQYGVIVTCASEQEQREIYERLTAEGMACKIVVT